ncbi:hypothetical protein ACH6EH_06725 [Paenibacillus sp. JSM ZJ436]|uniref:RNA dependent RNA polymerase n=1 Tax=Paenibacillus sp. JSM ZJ436 TaxID=3376190 RepID=UPI0037AD20D8
MELHQRLNKNYRYRSKLKALTKKKTRYPIEKLELYKKYASQRVSKIKDRLYTLFNEFEGIRQLRPEAFRLKTQISVFESTLTRTLGIKQDELSEDIIIVQTYFFDILENLIKDGFIYQNEKYICFTASAGQIRTKKTVFIKEKVFKQHYLSLMCGLSLEKINELGGVNINKYLAYLALCNSATEQWEDFDISKAIVVDDMETLVHSTVDFIDDKTYEITRQDMDIAIEHTDGCGMILPRKSKKNMMVRLPWIKGLLVPFPFDKFIREENRKVGHSKYGVIKDIYGVEHDILKERIEVIFTKSQFKMWKYYSSWEQYQELFEKYSCQAGKCNEEEDDISNAKLNYQMLQTLTDMTDKELAKLSEQTRYKIANVGSDRKTMLRILGVTDSNANKNYLQKALEIYPELLNDTYSKEMLKTVKKSMVKNAKAGKIDVSGKYTFISPDLYAFCEYLFMGNQSPKGLLSNGDVYCSLYRDGEKLDCLRSPHLYREHALRRNVLDAETKRWFITPALYTSCHDPISKVLMFDNDGDKALVCNDKTLVEVAERNMKGIYPLYYKMAKADAEKISSDSVYNGLIAAYTGGNIGMISNDITKIWNSDNVNLDVIKMLCMENNFVIDYAKTLYKPVRPQNKKKMITGYTKAKVPHFFIQAKDKEVKNVSDANNSTMNRLAKMINNPRLNFKAANIGTFDYKVLLSDKDAEVVLDEDLINTYIELDQKKHFMMKGTLEDSDTSDDIIIYKHIRNSLLNKEYSINQVVDMLVAHLYITNNSNYKTTLWSSFGDVLVANLKKNVDMGLDSGFMQCSECGKRILLNGSNQQMCKSCWKIRDSILNKQRCKRHYEKKKEKLKSFT